MRCARGIFAKGILGCTGFSLLRWGKGSETPACDGEKGLRLPRSSCSEIGKEGVSDPLPHRKRESQTLFPVHPKIPLAKIPLAQHIRFSWLWFAKKLGPLQNRKTPPQAK